MKKILVLIVSIVFCNSNLKAQDENCPECGWYVDGIKVDKIDCYSFDRLTLVLPYNSGMKGYDKINVWVKKASDKSEGMFAGISSAGTNEGVKSVPGSAINTILKGNYIVITIFSKAGGDKAILDRDFRGQDKDYQCGIAKSWMSKKRKEKNGKIEQWGLNTYASGATITGYEEVLDQTTNMIVKTPVYSTTNLTKVYLLKCENSVGDDNTCTYTGTKLDFNSLGGKSSSGNSNAKTPVDKKATKEDDDKEDDKD